MFPSRPTRQQQKESLRQYNQQVNKQKQKQQKQRGNNVPVTKKKNIRILNAQPNIGTYGSQINNVLKQGLGATLRSIPSALDFARVYADPFSTRGARLPILPIYSTKLLRTRSTGTGILNTNGFGWVSCVPYAAAGSDLISVYYSNAAGSPPQIEGSGTIGTASSNSSYTSSSYSGPTNENGLGVRCVAFGVRVRFTGTDLNASGVGSCAQLNPRQSMNGYGQTDISKQQGYKEWSFASRRWFSCCRQITNAIDNSYYYYGSGGWEPLDFGVTSSDENSNYMSIFLTGVGGQSFEWEVVGHYEVIGPNLDTQDVTELDSSGSEAVITHFAQLRHKDNTTQDHMVPSMGGSSSPMSWSKTIGSIANKVSPLLNLIPGVGPIASGLATSLGKALSED